MAPEQALGKPADERSDIYSLGCVLYALLAGHPPFNGDAAAAVLNQHANIAPRPLDTENSRVSTELNAVVLQMLSKSPDDRPQTAAQVRDRLTPPVARPAAVAAVTAATERLGQTTATRSLPRAARADRRWLILAGALATLVLVIAVVALASGGGPLSPTTNARHDTKASNAKTPTARSPTTPPTAPTTAPATKPATSRPRAGHEHTRNSVEHTHDDSEQHAAEHLRGRWRSDCAHDAGRPIRDDRPAGSTADQQRRLRHSELL
jgi:serine/threonine protein kinase